MKDLERRITRLEGRLDADDRSIVKRVSMFGSLLALTVAIAVGAFQLWEGLVLRQKLSFEESQREINGYVSRIIDLKSRISNLKYQFEKQPSDLEIDKQIQFAQLEKLSVVDMANRLIMQEEGLGSFTIFLLLAMEYRDFEHVDDAISYFQKAKNLARSTIEEIEADRHLYFTLFMKGEDRYIKKARNGFQKLLKLTRNNTSSFRSIVIINIYEDWIISEERMRECKNVKDLWYRMKGEFPKNNFNKSILGNCRSYIFSNSR